MVWYSPKTSYTGNIRKAGENEVIVPDQGRIQSAMPTAEWGTRRFLGWFTEKEGGEKLDEYAIFRGKADTTVYAQWDEEGTADERTEVKVSFYRKSSYFDAYEIYADVLAAPETYAELISSLRFGFSLSYTSESIPEGQIRQSGWFTAPTGGERINNSAKKIPTSIFSLYYGSELAKNHYVTFEPNGGVLSEYVVTEPVMTKPDEYTFTTTTCAVYSSSSTKTTATPPASNQILVTEGRIFR